MGGHRISAALGINHQRRLPHLYGNLFRRRCIRVRPGGWNQGPSTGEQRRIDHSSL